MSNLVTLELHCSQKRKYDVVPIFLGRLIIRKIVQKRVENEFYTQTYPSR